VVGVDDGGHDVTAESGTNLIEKVGIVFARFGVGVVADFEGCTVGGETAVEAGRNAGTEVAADAGGAHEADLRFNFLEEVDKDGCVGIGGIGIEAFVLNLVNGVDSVGEELFFDVVEFVAYNDGFEFDTEFVGKDAAFGEELKADIGNTAFVKLTIYDEIVSFFF